VVDNLGMSIRLEAPTVARHDLDTDLVVDEVVRGRRRNGSIFWNALQITPLFNPDVSVSSYAGFQHDISEACLTAYAGLSMDDPGLDEAGAPFPLAVADTDLHAPRGQASPDLLHATERMPAPAQHLRQEEGIQSCSP
jgi:hypothetical protein